MKICQKKNKKNDKRKIFLNEVHQCDKLHHEEKTFWKIRQKGKRKKKYEEEEKIKKKL